jgi:hypothetical protein
LVRVWSGVEDRLIEVVAEPGAEPGLRIEGLPDGRGRTAADRVRAAMVNSGLLEEAPGVVLRVEPSVQAGPRGDLDVALALAALAHVGVFRAGLGWIHASGRLRLDGVVHRAGLPGPLTLADVVSTLCHTPPVESEHMFGRHG